MQCLQCTRPFDSVRDRVATICRSFMGDENIENWFLCPVCGVYTLSSSWDRFSGGESEALRGPIPKAEGDGKVSLIRQCPRPWSKRCGCDAHRKYFDDRLD